MPLILFVISFFFLNPAFSLDQKFSIQLSVETLTLKNGLKIRFHYDKNLPFRTVMICYQVGSINESFGKRGYAHLFEHLLFKGTKKYPAKKVESRQALGGIANNAFTSKDRTCYYEAKISSLKDLKFILNMEADRMQNLVLKFEDVKIEKEVVKEELRQSSHSIFRILYQEIYKLIASDKRNSYHWPVIGYLKDLNSAVIKDFTKFYKNYYQPQNAVLSVIGPDSIKTMKKEVKRFFAPLKNVKPVPVLKNRPDKSWPSHVVVYKKKLKTSIVALIYPGPKECSTEIEGLNLALQSLGGSAANPLQRVLIHEKRLAFRAWSWHISNFGMGAIVIAAEALNKNVSNLKKEMIKLMNNFYKNKITESSFQNSQKILLKGFLENLEEGRNIAAHLADPWCPVSQFIKKSERYAALTKKQIHQIIQKYLSSQSQSILEIRGSKK